jgi:putative transferase (TIGR04331 family)
VRELILTGLPEFWPVDENNALFLGPWCFAHHPKYRFEQYLNFEIAPAPVSSSSDLLRASQYIDSLCDRILPGFSGLMNRFHGVGHSQRFWKIIIVNWLVHWTGVCYDRYQRLCRLKDARAGNELFRVSVIAGNTVCPESWQEYNAHMGEHAYNHQILSDILRESGEFEFVHATVSDVRPRGLPAREPGVRCIGKSRSTGERVKAVLDDLAGRLVSPVLSHMNPPCLLGNIHGMGRVDKLRIQLGADPLAAVKLTAKPRAKPPRIGERSKLLTSSFDFDGRNAFEETLRRILPAHLPDSFLSYHPDYEPAHPTRRIWIGNELHGGIARIYRLAHCVERGGRWISVQHGGGYGMAHSLGLGKVEYETPGAFATWGWSAPQGYAATFHPLPSPMLSKLPRHRPGGDRLIFVGTMVPSYHYRFHSVPQPEHLLAYLQWKERFLRHTDASLHDKLLYRPYMHNYGIDEVAHVRRAVPTCAILDAGPLIDALRRARLVVIDHLATSFLEAFAMNAPTILFWDPAVYALSPEAEPFFDALRSTGILFDTPEAAAHKVNDVWPNVAGWWHRKDVQETRAHFCRQFALSCKHWRRAWAVFLKRQLL